MNLLVNFAPINKLSEEDIKTVEELCPNLGRVFNISYLIDSPKTFGVSVNHVNTLDYKTYEQFTKAKGKYQLITKLYNVPVYELSSSAETEELLALHKKLVKSMYDVSPSKEDESAEDFDYHKFMFNQLRHKFYIVGLEDGENEHGHDLYECYCGIVSRKLMGDTPRRLFFNGENMFNSNEKMMSL